MAKVVKSELLQITEAYPGTMALPVTVAFLNAAKWGFFKATRTFSNGNVIDTFAVKINGKLVKMNEEDFRNLHAYFRLAPRSQNRWTWALREARMAA